jgi:small subunit ribosomal protein S20
MSSFFGEQTPADEPLANIQSAKKRARQAVKRRAHNVALRSRVRSAIKRVLKAVQSGDKAVAKATFAEVVPEIDRMAGKGILTKHRAAHYKSQLNLRLRAMP